MTTMPVRLSADQGHANPDEPWAVTDPIALAQLQQTVAHLAEVVGALSGVLQVTGPVTDAQLRATPLPTTTKFADENGVAFSSANPLPVNIGANLSLDEVTVGFESVISVVNSSQDPLPAGGEFLGEWEDVHNYAAILAVFKTDVPSAPLGATIEFSEDGVTAIDGESATVPGGFPGFAVIVPKAHYVRVRYINGPTPQTYLRSEIRYAFTAPGLTQTPIGGVTTDASIAALVKSTLQAKILTGPYAGLWTALGTDGEGNLFVETGLGTTLDLVSTAVEDLRTRAQDGLPLAPGTIDAITTALETVSIAGPLALDEDTVTALQQVTATIDNLPTDYPDAATVAALGQVVAAIQALPAPPSSVSVDNLPASYPLPASQLDALAPRTAVSIDNLPAAYPLPADQVTALTPPTSVEAVPPEDTDQLGTVSAVGATVSVELPAGASSVGLQITGDLAGTLVFEHSVNGVDWHATQLRGPSTALNTLQTSTTTVPSRWRGNVGGLRYFRVRCSARTAGTATIQIVASTGAGGTFILAPIPIGAVSSGNTATGVSVAAGATWTGAFEQTPNVASVNVVLTSDRDGTLFADYSIDGTTAYRSVAYPVTAGIVRDPVLAPRGEYLRFRFTNLGVTAATMSIETLYRAAALQTPLLAVGAAVPVDALGAVSKAIVEPINAASTVLRTLTAGPAVRVDQGLAGRKSVMVRARDLGNGQYVTVGFTPSLESRGNGNELASRESVVFDLASNVAVYARPTQSGLQIEVTEAYDQ